MKKNLMAVGALAIAIAFSSFTNKTDVQKYLVYQSGTERDINSFASPTTTQPSHVIGSGKLNWFRVLDVNNDGIDVTEFNGAFDAKDIKPAGSPNQLLSDEVDISGQLDVKN